MGTERPQPPEAPLGRRVSCGGERATVRFVGPVPPTAGLWLGVEWDHPGRGKHDGSHAGVSYFTCRHPTGGSFIRPEKASFGLDYLDAVHHFYGMETEEEIREDGSSKEIKWIRVKERSLQSLTSVLLNGSEVNGCGADGEIRKTTPNVQWLDLSGTLLSCWEDVASISQQLDHLEGLQLSSNRLRLPSDCSTLRQAFCSLKVLVLNSSQLTWTQILQSAPMWPQVEDLSVEDNSITELQRPEGVLQNLKSLNLSRNPLDQNSLVSISALPRLENLNLSTTGLTVLQLEDAAPGSQTSMFAALKKLNLDNNNMTEWDAINQLDKLSRLLHFSCRGNRLVSSDGNPRTANQMLIAKLGRLETLDGCEIHHEDRRGAELDYIKMFGEAWLQAGGRSQTSSEFSSQHPRYQKLIDKYGAPEEGELKKMQPFALKNQLLKISFVFPEDSGRKSVEKKLPASMLVQKVKGLLYRLLKVPAADLKLSYCSPKMPGTEFEMDGDLKTLQFYSIEDGDQVLVRWS